MPAQTTASTTPLLFLDGGIGSELRRRGVALPGKTWSATANLEHKDLLTTIHCDYISAGADIITANTFATNRFVLEAAALGERFEEINRAAVDAAKAAVENDDVAIAASISCLPPAFDVRAYPSPARETSGYAELAELLADLGVELLLAEMLQHPEHAARACQAAAGTGLPFWAGISCQRSPATEQLVAFNDAEQPIDAVIEAVLPFRPAGIAVMHTPVDLVSEALVRLKRYWNGPIGAWAEIPYTEDPDYVSAPDISPETYATHSADWRDVGATLLGGCCGTTPEHIARMRAALGA